MASKSCNLIKTDNYADPNAPKRGLSAYMFFANEQREKVRADNPNMKFGTFCPMARVFRTLIPGR